MLKRTLLFLLLTIPLSGWGINIENVTTVPATCYGNGEIHVETSGAGNETISYYIYRDGINYASQDDDNIFTNLPAGTYSLQVVDGGDGSRDEWEDIIIEDQYPGDPRIRLFPVRDDGFCEVNGQIRVEITNGRPPFTLELLDTANNVLRTETAYNNDDFYFTGLANGDYRVRITDACDGSQIVTTNVFSLNAPAAGLPSFNDITTTKFDYTWAIGNSNICGQLSLYYNFYQNAGTENVIIGDAETATTYYQYIQMSWVYDAGGEDEQSGTYGYMTNQTIIAIQNFDPSKSLTITLEHPCDGSVLTIDASLPDESTVYVTEEILYFEDGCALEGGIGTPGYKIAITNEFIENFSYCLDSKYFPLTTRIEKQEGAGWVSVTDQFGTTNANGVIEWNASIIRLVGGFEYGQCYRITVNSASDEPGEKVYQFCPVATSGGNMQGVLIQRAEHYNNIDDASGHYNLRNCDFDTGALRVIFGTSDKEVYMPFDITYYLYDEGDKLVLQRTVNYTSGKTNTVVWTNVPVGNYTLRTYYSGTPGDPGACFDSFPVTIAKVADEFAFDVEEQRYDCDVTRYLIRGRGYYLLDNDTIKSTAYGYQYRMVVFDSNGKEYASVWTNSGETVEVALEEPGKYEVSFFPYDGKNANASTSGSCSSLSLEDGITFEKYVSPTIDLGNSIFIVCDEDLQNDVYKASLWVRGQGYVRFKYWSDEEGSQDDPIDILYPSTLVNPDGVTEIILGLDIYKPNQEKYVWYIMIASMDCPDHWSSRYEFRLYTTGDTAAEIYGWNGTDDDRYLCDKQTGVYLEVDENIGKVDGYQWYFSSTGEEDTFEMIDGATSARYNIEMIDIHVHQGGVFRVEITLPIENCGSWVTDVPVPVIYPLPEKPVIDSDCSIVPGTTVQLTAVVNNPDNDPYVYTWYRHTNASTEELGEGTEVWDTTLPGIYTVSIRREGTICESDVSDPYVLTLPLMYWNGSQNDFNWNNIDNWSDGNGDPAETIPQKCTIVHIPGNLENYPSLDEDHTDRTLFDARFNEPKADDIIYHFGGETAYPHLLDYNRAFVQYNFGVYDGATTTQPAKSGDEHAPAFMERDRKYALAAPLKRMVSGDFGMAGYPHTWQYVFNMENPETGELTSGDFSESFATNDVVLTETYNALAVQVASYRSGEIGYSNHRDLEGLNGILEMPYFENSDITPWRPNHRYFPLLEESRLYYYDKETLKILNSPIGYADRGDMAYRFIFEDDSNTAPALPSGDKGYQINVSVPASALEVMIGNPFMASINSERFYAANASTLADVGYKTYSQSSASWESHLFDADSNIGPLQAFVVTFNASGTQTLYFPLDGTNALTGAAFIKGNMEAVNHFSLRIRLVDQQGTGGAAALLIPVRGGSSAGKSVTKMIDPASHSLPEAFFISTDERSYNGIQSLDYNTEQIPVGIKTSAANEEVQLLFENTDNFIALNSRYPVLEDKALSKYIDLRNTSSYIFMQRPVSEKQQYTDKDRFVIHLLDSPAAVAGLVEKNVRITCLNKQLTVTSDKGIKRISIHDTSGRKVYDTGTLIHPQEQYTRLLTLKADVYIVDVVTADGAVSSQSVIVR